MIEFSSNGIAVPKSWDGVYEYVAKRQKELVDEWAEELKETGSFPDVEKDDRDMYILERSDSLDLRWHHAGVGASSAPAGHWRPICVIQEGTYAASYMHGFVDAMEAVEVVLWDYKKRVSSEQIDRMVKHLVEMERI